MFEWLRKVREKISGGREKQARHAGIEPAGTKKVPTGEDIHKNMTVYLRAKQKRQAAAKPAGKRGVSQKKEAVQKSMTSYLRALEKTESNKGEGEFGGPGYSGTYEYATRTGVKPEDFGMRRRKSG